MTTTQTTARQTCSSCFKSTTDYVTARYGASRRFHLCSTCQATHVFYVVMEDSRHGTPAVGKGFYGNNPERYWVRSPLVGWSTLDAGVKTWDTFSAAECFIRGTGDSSWNLRVRWIHRGRVNH